MASFMTGIRSIFPDVVQVTKRFPISVAIALLLTCWLLMGVYQRHDVDNDVFALLSAFFASVGAALYGERKGLCSINNALWSFGICVFIGSFFLVAEQLYITPHMVPIALLLLASTVAYIVTPLDNRAYWQFNHSFWFSFIAAVLGSLLIAGLITLLITSYSVLFEVTVKSPLYQYSLIICMFLIGPLFWLSMLPHDFTTKVKEGEPEGITSKITALFVKYVFVPFFFLFALLFHGLAAKVLFAGQLPTGQIGWYGFALVTTGIVTYLMVYPTRTVSGPLVSFFSSYWMWFLLVPLMLMAIAYQQRLEQYGLTPLRFYLGGFLLWAFALIAYALFRKGQKKPFDLRVIALGAALIIGFASIGPWGAEALSNRAQKQRLISDLDRLGVLQDGKIIKPIPRQLQEEAAAINRVNGAVSFFGKRNRAQTLETLLNDADHQDLTRQRQDGKAYQGLRNRTLLAVKAALQPYSVDVARQKDENRAFSFKAHKPLHFDLPSKGELSGPFHYIFPNEHRLATNGVKITSQFNERKFDIITAQGKQHITLSVEGPNFLIKANNKQMIQVPLTVLKNLAKQHQQLNQQARQDMPIHQLLSKAPNASAGAKLLISEIHYEVSPKDKDLIGLITIGVWLFQPN